MRHLLLLSLVLLSTVISSLAAERETPLLATAAEFTATEVPEWADRTAVQTALEDAGENWRELAQALREAGAEAGMAAEPKAAYQSMIWLITNAPHLDRLELTSAMLTRNVEMALVAAEVHNYDSASEFFQRYVLNYRLDDEPVTDWRGELAQRYNAQQDPGAIAAAVAQGFTVRERGYFGPLADPLSVDNARAGTGQELAVLTAAAVRSRGYGTRFVREGLSGKSWVEVYTGNPREYDATAWTPLYPSAPEHNGETAYAAELCGGRLALVTAGDAFGQEQVTARYSKVCGVTVEFTRGGAAVPDYEHWSITALNNGQIVPLDDLGYPLGEMDYPLDAGPDGRTVYYVGAPGTYQLQAGVRYPSGIVDLLTRDFTAEPGEQLDLTLALDAPDNLPATALAERQVALPPSALDPAPRAWLFVIYDDSEPSVRALELLKGYQDDPRVAYEADPYDADCPDLRELARTTLLVTDEDPKPVVVLVIDGETKLYRLGYDLSIAQWIERALTEAGL
jgi:hypothetical protein